MSNTATGAMVQMPKYKCHKEVWALKIKFIETEKMPQWKHATCKGSYALGTACGHCECCTWEKEHGPKLKTFITPEENGYGPFEISTDYLTRHKPEVGGYYVVYKDGYLSYSPAAAFEEGYTRLA